MEQTLWKRGCLTWQDALDNLGDLSFGAADLDKVERVLNRSVEALANGEHQFFTPLLGLKEAWRAFPSFRESCAYVDIETDGGKGGQSITMIGLYDGQEFECFIRKQSLESFRDRISHFSMIITFFGASFDLPIILKAFPRLVLDQVHVDLCPTLKSVGVGGGLKKIEKFFGIDRGGDTDGLNGYDAILLWRKWEMTRNQGALDRLVAYNREDVVNMERLAEIAYEMKKSATFDAVFANDYLA